MKLFRLSTYKLYRPNFLSKHQELQDPFKIIVMSDLHFSYQVSDRKLQAILNQVKLINPSYLLFPGDLIDTVDMVDKKAERTRLLKFLEELGRLTVVILSLGNHDMYRKSNPKQSGWQYESASFFFDQIRQLKNIHLLDNQVYEDDYIYCLGYTQSFAYYKTKEDTAEGLQIMLDELSSLPEEFLQHLPADKLKFALVHSPVHLNDSEVKYRLREFDYFISGHMHNGIVPPILDELLATSRGIISPAKKIAPNNSRNTLKTYADKLLVVGALTTFHECIKPLDKLNAFFPSYLAVMEFTKRKTYLRKPYIKHSYKNW